MDDLRHERFQLLERLGQGGMGVVYRAVDKHTGTVVALKTLTSLSGDALLRFKREFRVLADLHHPNLVRLGELHHQGDEWFFTMELVQGEDLIRFVRGTAVSPSHTWAGPTPAPAPDRSASPAPPNVVTPPMEVIIDRVEVVIPQLVEAIEAVHRAGRVHRDIKPSNVLVERSGRVVLVDFGIVTDLTESADGPIVGTPAYMAPEQAAGESTGPAADWYALGVLLFELLTGTTPFVGPDAILGFKKTAYEAPRARELNPEIPQLLDELCAQLLCRDPDGRPDGPTILQVLDADRDQTAELAAPESITRFVGRQLELRVLHEAFTEAHEGRGAAVLIRGEAGIGKTALANHAIHIAQARQPSAVVLRARCYEQEAVPLAALDALVDSLAVQLSHLPHPDVARLLSGGTSYLTALFPVLGTLDAAERAASPTDEAGQAQRRLRAFDQLRELLRRLATERLVILFVDDLQWADTDTVDLLAYVLGGAEAPSVALVATLRPEEARHLDLSTLPGTPHLVDIEGLDDGAAEALLRAAWAEAEGREPLPDALDGAIEQAAGHPLFLLEMVRYATTHSKMVRPVTLPDALWRRVSVLPSGARRLMEVAALVGVPTPIAALAAAAELDAHETLKVVGQLRAAQLLRVSRVDGERVVEPYHNRLREAILDNLSETSGALTDMVERHLRIGRSLLATTTSSNPTLQRPEGSSSSSRDPEVFTVLRHLDLAHTLIASRDDMLQLARLHLTAAEQARDATAWDSARHHFQRGVECIGDESWDLEYALCKALHVGLMEAEYLTGSEDRAWARYRRMKQRMPHRGEKVALAIRVITLETAVGRFDKALELGRKEARKLGVELPEGPGTVDLIRETLTVSWQRRGLADVDIAGLPALADTSMGLALQVMVAMTPAAFFVDTSQLLLVLMRIASTSLTHGMAPESAYGIAGYGAVLAGAHERYGEARSLGDAAMALHRRFGSRRLEAKLLMVRGAYITPWVSTLSHAREELAQAASMAQAQGDTASEVFVLAMLGMVDFCAGRPIADVAPDVRTALAIALGRKVGDMGAMLTALLLFYEELGGRRVDRAAHRARLSDARTPCGVFYDALTSAELCWLDGKFDQAQEWMDRARAVSRVVLGQPAWVELQLMGALVDARQYEQPGVVRRFHLRRRISAAERFLGRAAAASPSFRDASLLVYGERLRLEGWHRAADAALERAAESTAPKHRAIALECRARLATSLGQHEKASLLLEDAAGAYKRWGALDKSNALSREARAVRQV